MAGEGSRTYRMVQEGWIFGDMKVLEGDAPIAHFSFGAWKTLGEFEFEGGTYEVVKKGGLSSLFRLERDGAVLCETTLAGVWSKRAEVSLDGVRYVVAWPAFDAKTILRRDGVEVGFVGKWKTWKREAQATFVESVPPLVRVFAMWLSVYKRRVDMAG